MPKIYVYTHRSPQKVEVPGNHRWPVDMQLALYAHYRSAARDSDKGRLRGNFSVPCALQVLASG